MKGSGPHPGPRYVALVRVLRATEGLWEASRVFFDRWELSPSQFNLLILLYERPAGCTQIELSRELIMHRSNVTGLVDRLEARGWVKRQDVHTDRRAYHIVLTPAGHRLLRQIPKQFAIVRHRPVPPHTSHPRNPIAPPKLAATLSSHKNAR